MTTASEDLDGECIHLITRRFCADCNGTVDLQRKQNDLEAERVLALPGWRVAMYGGRCAKSGHRYDPGSPIAHIDVLGIESSTGNWVGACCAPEAE